MMKAFEEESEEFEKQETEAKIPALTERRQISRAPPSPFGSGDSKPLVLRMQPTAQSSIKGSTREKAAEQTASRAPSPTKKVENIRPGEWH